MTSIAFNEKHSFYIKDVSKGACFRPVLSVVNGDRHCMADDVQRVAKRSQLELTRNVVVKIRRKKKYYALNQCVIPIHLNDNRYLFFFVLLDLKKDQTRASKYWKQ